MLPGHSLLEIRTGRDSEHLAQAAAHLFGALPKLRNHSWNRLLGSYEKVSFEICVIQQTVYFWCVVPTRLAHYFKGLISASYPGALISILDSDPLDILDAANPVFATTGGVVKTGVLKLRYSEQLPLKTYQELQDVDSLSALISTLSASQEQDVIVIQLVVRDDGERWKHGSLLGNAASSLKAGAEVTVHPHQSLIDRKIAQRALKASLRLIVKSESADRTHLLLDNLAATFQSTTQSDGNQLVLKKPLLFKQGYLRTILKREFGRLPSQHLSLDELATLYHLPHKGLSSIPNIAWGKNLFSEPPDFLPVITRDTDPAIKKDVNVFAQTLYKNSLVNYGLKKADRRRHMYVIGKTGTGKSTLLANMAINDLKNDEGLCVIDPHGDLVETILDYIPSHRINDVVYFDPSDPERTVKINLFEGKNVAHRELIASGIVSIFQKLYEYSWGPRLEYILRNALLTLLKSDQARLSDILELLTNEKFREKIVEKLDDPILKSFWLNEFGRLQERQKSESIAPILNKVGQFVSSPLIRDVVNARQSSFDIEDIMSQGKILLVNLSQGKLGEDNATLLGAMLITKIQLAAMSRVHIKEEDRRDFYLYVDEFQNFATQSFNKILSEARKYRLNLVLANQYIAQIPEDVQKAIFGNCGSMVSFVMGPNDADAFAKEYAQKYTPEDLVSLGRYQIINKLSIDNVVSLPFTAQTLSLAKSTNQNRDKVLRVSRERYATKKEKH